MPPPPLLHMIALVFALNSVFSQFNVFDVYCYYSARFFAHVGWGGVAWVCHFSIGEYCHSAAALTTPASLDQVIIYLYYNRLDPAQLRIRFQTLIYTGTVNVRPQTNFLSSSVPVTDQN